MSVATYTSTGAKATTAVKLPKEVFGVEVASHQLLKEAYVAYMANGRLASATTKTRGLVSGGGKKPWSQKGTGRARFGSSRNPIWRGGGVVFGPDGTENYSRSLNAKAKKLALRQALSLAATSKNIVIVEEFAPKAAKTSAAAELLTKIGAPTRTLIVVEAKTPEIVRATNNLPEVIVSTVGGLNVFDVMNASNIVLTKGAVTALQARLKVGGDN